MSLRPVFVLFAALAVFAAGAAQAAVKALDYRVVHSFPHDPRAFTEGLFYLDGYLYESTGLNGQSSIRKERLETGEVVMSKSIPDTYFGEGVTAWGNRLFELTWRSQVGFIYDLATFAPVGAFHYPGEGWALTHDSRRLIMSDGTPFLRFLDPRTLRETGRIEVRRDGVPLANINELEWVRGAVYANVWQTNLIVRIDPASGKVTGELDLGGLLAAARFNPGPDDVLNGIAYDAARDRLFVTGKNWPRLFEIKIIDRHPTR